MIKSLRPYQVNAKNAVFETVEEGGDRALIVMATGLGKTFTGAEIYQEWFNRFSGKALFVVHQVEITEQAMAEFKDHLPEGIVCGLLTSDRAENVSTCHILFTTFQSMHERTRRLFERDHFNLIIVDEAHHSHADTYRPVIEYFNTAFRLGLTATPNRADGQNIRDIFGEEVFSYTLAQGIADGYLAQMDYRVESDNIDAAKLQELVDRATGGGRHVSREDIDSTIFLHERLEALVSRVREVEQSFGRRMKKIIFCRNLVHVREVHKHFEGSVSYHSKLARDQQRSILADFKAGNTREILVRDMFNEGIDVPDAEMLVFLRGTESETIWIQQLGRGLRLSNGKTHVVVLDFVANCDRVAAVSKLRDQIVGASRLSVNDDRDLKSKLLIRGTGWSFSFTEEIRDVLALLQRWELPFYATLEEAGRAAQGLEIKKKGDYARKRAADPRLPYNPNQVYADTWQGWPAFLGTREPVYEMYGEAKASVQRIKFEGWKDYQKRYRTEDPRLPSNPDVAYKNEWEGWKTFLGNGETLYKTYAETRAAALKLGLRNSLDYRERRHLDLRLTSSPYKRFKAEWQGWGPFLEPPDES